MALATITETLELPGGVVPTGTLVTLRLIAVAEGNAVGYASSATVLWTTSTTIATDGTYTFTDVRPNVGTSDDAITSPAGTVYELRVVVPGATSRPAARYISVPDSTGPHQVADLLTIAPDPLPTGQDLLDLIDAAGLDLTDLPNGVTADAVIGLDGGALVELTPAQVMATHTGDTSDAHDAAAISYAGGTGMSATDVEAAIDELANEKANLAGAAFTGAVTVTGADLTVTGAGGGSLHLDTNPSDDAATLAIYGSGDTQPRIAVGFSVFDVPAINMGPGGSTPADVTLYRSEAGVVHANGGGFTGLGKGLTLTEQSAPSSPAVNDITLYAADNGSGTTVLRTKDSAGTVTTLGSGGGTYTDEEAQDAVGTILVDGTTVDFTYSDATPSITAEVKATSLTNSHISGSAAIALSKLATDPLARANHTGTQAGTTVDAATDAARGTVELATTAETQTGTDTTRAVTPAGGAATYATLSDPMGWGFAASADPRIYSSSGAGVGSANTAFYTRAIGARTVTKIGAYFTASSGNVDVGVYAATGTGRSSAPSSRRVSAGTTVCPAIGYAEVTVASTAMSAGDWFAWAADNTTAALAAGLSGTVSVVTGLTASQATAFPLPATPTPGTGGRNHLLMGY